MKDLVLDPTMDLQITDGDFAIANSTNQHLECMFRLSTGELKEYPEAGIAINRSSNGAIDRFLEQQIRIQMETDGYRISELNITPNGVQISGDYE